MSNIMDSLKKLETTVTIDGANMDPPVMHSLRLAKRAPAKHGQRTIMVLLALIGFGTIGYFAGINSQKGDSTGPEEITDIANANILANKALIDKYSQETRVSISTEIPVSEDITPIVTNEEGPVVVMSSVIPETPVPEKEGPVIHQPQLVKNDTDAPAAEASLASRQSTVISDEAGESSAVGSDEKATALASAIMKSTEEPITAEEELNNNKTVRILNILGVVKEEQGIVAMINGEAYEVGDNIRQFIIEEINEDCIILSFKGKLYRKLVY